MSKHALRVALPLLGVAAVVGVLGVLGRWARDSLRQDDRFTLPFAAIECLPSPGAEQRDFIAEVQYLGSFPDQVRLLDDALKDRIFAAFERHPWVESVSEVRLDARRIQVRLRFRRAVLAVPYQGQTRAVDGNGILLPRSANPSGLPVYPGKAPPPAGPEGTAWGNREVEMAARAAAKP